MQPWLLGLGLGEGVSLENGRNILYPNRGDGRTSLQVSQSFADAHTVHIKIITSRHSLPQNRWCSAHIDFLLLKTSC